MKKVPDILTLEEIKKEDIPSVGGKGASLGEMFSIGLPVPRAFVVTAQAFRRFLGETGIEERLFAGLAGLNVDDNAALEEASRKARELVLSVPIPQQLQKRIKDAYRELRGDPVVAVRSSATAEDLPDASFAGQQETYLNIQGNGDLIQAVQRCWASPWWSRSSCRPRRQG
jgi:pyruvate,water dikinase